MASKHAIEMDFQLATRQADRLDEIANNILKLSNKEFSASLQDLSLSWKGENSERFIDKGRKLQSNISDTAGDLREIAGSIRTAAKRIYDAEMQAYEIANQRRYQVTTTKN